MFLQSPFGAPSHLSRVICMRPCSPAPPTVDGLQPLSCIANDASMIGGTVHRSTKKPQIANSRGHKLSNSFAYFTKAAMVSSLQGANVVCLAQCSGTVMSCSIVTRGGVQPSPVIPQLIQSILPLGPLSFVVFAAHNPSRNLTKTNKRLTKAYLSRRRGCTVQD
jgi:hypothetical protein